MVVEILTVLAALFLAAAAHPFMTYPLSLYLFASRHRLKTIEGAERPSCAICMCAYNEEAVIVGKVEQMIAMARQYGPATVHVYLDGCSDRTAELIEPYRDRIDLVVSAVRTGKTHGMNVLIQRSDSVLLQFTDANVVADQDALVKLAEPFSDPKVGCTTARLVYSNPGESATSYVGSLYWAIEEAVKQIESDTVGVVGVDGASFVVRRSLYQAAPPELIDDLYVTLRVLTSGSRVVRVPEVVVHERSAVKPGEEFRRKVRIACQAMNVHRALHRDLAEQPLLVRYSYFSHRLLKWLMPYFVLMAGLCLLAAAGVAFGPVAVSALASVAIAMIVGGAAGIPILSLGYTSLVALTGVGVGVAQSLLGKQNYRTWEPAVTVRSSTEDLP